MTHERLQELKQSTFDTIWQHAVIDGSPPSFVSILEWDDEDAPVDVQCRYRHEGNCCFMGVFIPDDKYNDELEGMSAKSVAEIIWEPTDVRRQDEYLEFLNNLQRLHDYVAERQVYDKLEDPSNGHWGEIWKPELIEFAEEHDLNYVQ